MATQSIRSVAAKPASILPGTALPLGRSLIHCFRSIHLAIILLALLAIGTIIGVVMPQEGMVELATIRKEYGPNFEFLRTLGFFSVYSSFWFVTLQILFFFNLLIGSFKWLKPATLAAIQRYTLPVSLIAQKPAVYSLPELPDGAVQSVSQTVQQTLKRFGYRLFTDADGNLYASKWNISRLGPAIAHVGILICLMAGVLSAFTGFKAMRLATPGDPPFSISEANTFKTNLPTPFWQGKIPDWRIGVEDFTVDYYKEHPGTAKQYYSKLQIVSPEGKRVLKRETISVNHPLLYDDLSIYQASFAPTGRFILNVDGVPHIADVTSEFQKRPICVIRLPHREALIMFPFFAGQDQGVTENHAVFFLRHPGETFNENQMPASIKLNEGQNAVLKGHAITFVKPEMQTGLQIKRAPEVPWMYLSYLIIGIGTALCFFSQRQIWVTFNPVTPDKTEVLLFPKTNKARLSFRKELLTLQDALLEALKPKSTGRPSQEPAS